MLLSHALGAGLTLEESHNYWDNQDPHSFRRLALLLSENTYFYPRLISAELPLTVALAVVCLVALVVATRTGSVELLELVAIVVFFTEVGLGKLVRMWWMKLKLDCCHEAAVRLAKQWPRSTNQQKLEVIDVLCEYETIKARGGYRPRDRTFKRLNETLTREWQELKREI